ncbi:MAG TPA: hypothetical protein PKU91_03135, partial [Phycisphaerales bacterium]|nr:hypothetical protein [Phycisphaerales bacterium]
HASGLPIRKFTWRHGSILDRQRRLDAMVGRPMNRLAIDREARWMKVAIALGLIAVLSIMVGGYLLASVIFPAGASHP